MKYISLVLSFFYCSLSLAQLNRIDHFIVVSPNAEQLYHLLRNDFQLPVLWPYQTFRGFASGGVSLGNVTLELVARENLSRAHFASMALEPRESAEKMVRVLDSLDIPHGTVSPYVTTLDNGGKDTLWKTVTLNEHFFICDYNNRSAHQLRNKRAGDSLQQKRGGPLGIIKLKEIVGGGDDLPAISSEIIKLPGIKGEKENLFTFSTGPSIRLVNSEQPGIQKIILLVKSIAAAKSYLQSKGMLGMATGDSLFIDPKAVDGLEIELREK